VVVISTVTVHAALPRFPLPDAGRLTVAVGSRWGRVLLTAAAAGVSLLAEPVRHTLGFGQVNLLLCAVIVVDCLLVPAGRRGYLVGAATAVKLTPAVFLLLFRGPVVTPPLRVSILSPPVGVWHVGLFPCGRRGGDPDRGWWPRCGRGGGGPPAVAARVG